MSKNPSFIPTSTITSAGLITIGLITIGLIATGMIAPPEAHADNHESTSTRPGVVIESRSEDPYLKDLAVASTIEDRKPQGAGDRFPASVGKLYCWTQIHNRSDPTQVKHIWRRGDRVISELTLKVGRSIRWRTWSQQRMPAKATGTWSCEVTDSAGQRLGIATVTVE